MTAKHSRPYMPGYGIVAESKGVGLLPWSLVEERMVASRNYWIASAQPNGRPHAAPVWGLWHDGKFYFSTGEASRKGRNLEASPAVSVHLESGDEVVILEGEATAVSNSELLESLDKAYIKKYGMAMQGPGIILTLGLQKALAWREKDFPESATRWIFN
ncbi:MAG TPA: pyridoxamine 5'-phosphate oxidase family protein [Anaerolineales bacterium]|nr:pyridoxamine 5'-phosphate oxidase family protein [Anaerolineales bacterium]